MKPTTTHAAPADVLEMLFSNRNKAYGAYQLRREYPEAMRKALIFTLLLIGALVALAHRRPGATPQKAGIEVISDWKTQVKLEEKKPPVVEPQPQEAPVAAKPQSKLLPPKLISNATVEPIEEPPTFGPDDLPKGAAIGAGAVGGGQGSPFLSAPVRAGGGQKFIEDPAPAPTDDEPQTYVSVIPTFPGGEAELLRYLQANIRYPVLAKETCIQGRVIVQFVVEKDGRITDAKILRDIGGGREALRVLGTMPPWKPGNQNGQRVRVRLVLPVSFQLK